jgi:hypothetical protein
MHSAVLAWLAAHEQSLAIWLEGLALVAIFGLELKEYRRQGRERIEQHNESVAQMKIMQSQADAANKSAEALINSERAWVIAELIPQAVRTSGNHWCRVIGSSYVSMSAEEILRGHHLRYNLKLTNMGRTPAQIFGFATRYSCLGKGVTDLPENAGGNQVSSRPFEHLLSSGSAVEIGEPIDVGQYMQEDVDSIQQLEKTAVIHGSVKYRHIFSADDNYAEFCYVYTVSEERLSSVGRHTRQRQEKTGTIAKIDVPIP